MEGGKGHSPTTPHYLSPVPSISICRPWHTTTSYRRNQTPVPARLKGSAAPQEEDSPTWFRLTWSTSCRHAIATLQRASSDFSWPCSGVQQLTPDRLRPGLTHSRDSRCRQQRAKPPSIFIHGGIHPFPVSRRSWPSSPVCGRRLKGSSCRSVSSCRTSSCRQAHPPVSVGSAAYVDPRPLSFGDGSCVDKCLGILG